MIAIAPMNIVKIVLCVVICHSAATQKPTKHKNYATILQDSRYEPTPDGTFRYQYKTEDGIISTAQGDPSGVIHGTFSYTDPTGLRVNYNYNAGTRRAQASSEEEEDELPVPQKPIARPSAVVQPQPQPRNQPQPRYQPQPQPRPQPDPVSRPTSSARSGALQRPIKTNAAPVNVPAPKAAASLRSAQPIYREEPDYYSQPSEDQYVEVEDPYYRPRTRPSHRQNYQLREYRPAVRSNNIGDEW